MRLLITGCCGFIRSNSVHHILKHHRDWVILGLDKLTYAGNLENLADLGEERKRFFFLRGTSAFGKRFLYISTDEIYGEVLEGRAREGDPLRRRSPYAASKASADPLAQAYSVTYGLPVFVTRCTNNYGPYQFPEKLIPFMIWNALHYREFHIYGDGKQKREWIFVLDHCRALEAVLLSGRPGEVYNIGSGEEKENLEVMRMVLEILWEKTKDPGIHEGLIRHVTDRPGPRPPLRPGHRENHPGTRLSS